MKHASDLRKQLLSIHRKSYPAYKSLKGLYEFGDYTLSIDHVQGDPFASPSHVTIQIPFSVHRFPKDLYQTPETKTAFEDHLLRRFASQIHKFSFQAKGSGKSGLLSVSGCGQEILSRTACEIRTPGDGVLIFRFHVGFPANGRTINATELEKILFDFLPSCVEHSCLYRTCDKKKLTETFELAEDQTFIRQELSRLDLAAFVADGSVLPRQSGVSDLPMKDSVVFSSPDSLRVTLTLPHKGKLSGMGIPRGITLIVGGGYHGKSTLLKALETGVYPHIAGDGREYVITDATAVKLRSEDGRVVKNVDISLFINDLPNKRDTTTFSTLDASGSTSQAAGTVESMEANSRLFLIDEDTSATNFMVRDTFMQQVISREKEPITPFLERAGDLYEKAGISTILVAGSSGAFFHIADTVIQMDCYHPVDITSKVKELCRDYRSLHLPRLHFGCLRQNGSSHGHLKNRRTAGTAKSASAPRMYSRLEKKRLTCAMWNRSKITSRRRPLLSFLATQKITTLTGKKQSRKSPLCSMKNYSKTGIPGFSDILIFREATLFQGFRRSTPA